MFKKFGKKQDKVDVVIKRSEQNLKNVQKLNEQFAAMNVSYIQTTNKMLERK